MFSLDKLKVYDKALASAASLAQHSRSWDKRHAVTDQLLRASESFVLNLAEGARLRSAAKRQHVVDYAIGSALECAACLDSAQIKEFLCQDEALQEKRSLCEVVKMMVGLKKAWSVEAFHEEPSRYGEPAEWLFPHERLDAYRLSLEFMRWFHGLPGAPKLSTRPLRQVDHAGTSLVLNIAEANGRYASGERRNLFEIAESAVVRVGTYLELCTRTDKLDPEQKACAMALLDRIASMLRGLGSG
ncbi:MAG: four helix bundle protein [Desulfobacteraceae bacterium]|nr:MAG: four helix bundle protein [Desulfobacteraceae bacterium]